MVSEHFGFRVNSSTNKAIDKLLNELLNPINNKLMVGGIFCNLEKAFDCVNHNILLSKWEFYSIIGRTHKLIKSYLEDRFQRAEIISDALHNTNSDWGKISCGIPLLCLIYINILPKILRNISIPILFSHDTNIIITNSNPVFFSPQTNINGVKGVSEAKVHPRTGHEGPEVK